MSVHYQVNTNYVLAHGKPLLVNVTINSTKSAVTKTPLNQENTKSSLKTFRIFHTLKEAYAFIAYLKKIYGNIPEPVLDNNQQELF